MKQLTTTAIVLRRTDYGEADRILTLLTPEFGKLSLMAKGVRRAKSKLAGGIELFSVSHLTFIKGRSDLGTLVSSRLDKHYGNIVKNIERTMAGYELIKQLNRATEDNAEEGYFELLQQSFEALNDPVIPLSLINTWFAMQLLRLGGNAPNLETDTQGLKLMPDQMYTFDFDGVSFKVDENGLFTPAHIKFLRLGFAGYTPHVLQQIQDSAAFTEAVAPLVETMRSTYVRI